MPKNEALSPLGEKVFAEITSTLAKYSDRVTVSTVGRELRIEPTGPDTFPILIVDDGRELTIHVLGWHDHNENSEEVIACCMWMLTPLYRILLTERNGKVVKSSLEIFSPPGKWEMYSEIGILSRIFGFGRDLVRTYYQQSVIAIPAEVLSEFPEGEFTDDGLPIGTRLGQTVLDR